MQETRRQICRCGPKPMKRSSSMRLPVWQPCSRTLAQVSRVFSQPVRWLRQVGLAFTRASMGQECAGVHPGGRVPSTHESNVDGSWAVAFFHSVSPHPPCISSTIALTFASGSPASPKKPAVCLRQFVDSIRTAWLLLVASVAGVHWPSRFPGNFLYGTDGVPDVDDGLFVLSKAVCLLDVIVLAQLYTVRVYGGGAATGVPSHWLLTFSLFLFSVLRWSSGLPSCV